MVLAFQEKLRGPAPRGELVAMDGKAAQLYRHIVQHAPETVWLLTSREPRHLDATQWLTANRQYWGVGCLHQRLDASTNEGKRIFDT